MEKILYFLGAGASAKVLPLARSVWNIEDVVYPRIPGLAYELKKIISHSVLTDNITRENDVWYQDAKKRFLNISSKADEFGDVDTYAKYLNLMHPGGDEIQDLKRTLSDYFSIKQVILTSRDSRYLPWLVSIMKNKIFPDNVKILNWNYDFQVELAMAQINGLEEVNHRQNSFTYSPSGFHCLPNLDPTYSDHHLLSLIHLNGTAGFISPKISSTGSIFQNKFSCKPEYAISFLKMARETLIHFAWENSEYIRDNLKHATSMIEGTTIVVVIGYSFPFFNRECDKKIFEELTKAGKLRKIYFQDPILDGSQLRSQFNLSNDISITHIPKVDNFYIPFEY